MDLIKSTYFFTQYFIFKADYYLSKLIQPHPRTFFRNNLLKVRRRKQHNNYLPQSLNVNPELRVPIDSRSLSLSVSSLLELELSILFDFLYLLIGTSKCLSLYRCRLSLLLQLDISEVRDKLRLCFPLLFMFKSCVQCLQSMYKPNWRN